MLSDDFINNVVDNISIRQENITLYIVRKIAQKIAEVGKMNKSQVYQLERLLKTGADAKKINEYLAKETKLQINDIKNIMEECSKEAYRDTKPFYDYNQQSYIPYKDNKDLQKVIESISKQTINEYENLSQSQAFMIRDMKNPKRLIPTKLSRAYYSIIDEAVQASQNGLVDYNTAMRRTVKQLINSGLRTVDYTSEKGRRTTQRIEVAVRRNIMDGIRAINQSVQDETGKQYGADGKEITVHRYPAPDHAPIQGHQFTNKEYENMNSEKSFEDVNGNQYSPIKRGIGQWNCRHFAWSIIIGYANPNYSQEQLDKILNENEKGYRLPNGEHKTMYECTQMQREYERNIRKNKQAHLIAKDAEDEELANQYRMSVKRLLSEYKQFSKDCGLPVKMDKCFVEGYK